MIRNLIIAISSVVLLTGCGSFATVEEKVAAYKAMEASRKPIFEVVGDKEDISKIAIRYYGDTPANMPMSDAAIVTGKVIDGVVNTAAIVAPAAIAIKGGEAMVDLAETVGKNAGHNVTTTASHNKMKVDGEGTSASFSNTPTSTNSTDNHAVTDARVTTNIGGVQ